MKLPHVLLPGLSLCLLFAACKKKPRPLPHPSASAAASASLPGLVKKYRAMSAAERMNAAKNGCYVGKKCDTAAVKALFQAATGTEKDALQAAARPIFASQYDKALIAKGKKPDSVAATGKDGTTLEVKGPPCNRFLLENLMDDFGPVAREVGFKTVACENKALKARIAL